MSVRRCPPDGRLLVTAPAHGAELRVWDAAFAGCCGVGGLGRVVGGAGGVLGGAVTRRALPPPPSCVDAARGALAATIVLGGGGGRLVRDRRATALAFAPADASGARAHPARLLVACADGDVERGGVGVGAAALALLEAAAGWSPRGGAWLALAGAARAIAWEPSGARALVAVDPPAGGDVLRTSRSLAGVRLLLVTVRDDASLATSDGRLARGAAAGAWSDWPSSSSPARLLAATLELALVPLPLPAPWANGTAGDGEGGGDGVAVRSLAWDTTGSLVAVELARAAGDHDDADAPAAGGGVGSTVAVFSVTATTGTSGVSVGMGLGLGAGGGSGAGGVGGAPLALAPRHTTELERVAQQCSTANGAAGGSAPRARVVGFAPAPLRPSPQVLAGGSSSSVSAATSSLLTATSVAAVRSPVLVVARGHGMLTAHGDL